jgi:hypothetical protein
MVGARHEETSYENIHSRIPDWGQCGLGRHQFPPADFGHDHHQKPITQDKSEAGTDAAARRCREQLRS